jgi:two-component system chemotaxis response regulator CheY
MIATLDPATLTYLIVESRRYERNIIKMALRTHHFSDFLEADDAAEAFKIIQSDDKPVDFILVCQELPILSAFDFVRLVRRAVDSPDPEVPIIMLSDYAVESVVAEARASGVHDFIAKPFSPDLLFAHIRRTLLTPRRFIRTKAYVGPEHPCHPELRASELHPSVTLAEATTDAAR